MATRAEFRHQLRARKFLSVVASEQLRLPGHKRRNTEKIAEVSKDVERLLVQYWVDLLHDYALAKGGERGSIPLTPMTCVPSNADKSENLESAPPHLRKGSWIRTLTHILNLAEIDLKEGEVREVWDTFVRDSVSHFLNREEGADEEVEMYVEVGTSYVLRTIEDSPILIFAWRPAL